MKVIYYKLDIYNLWRFLTPQEARERFPRNECSFALIRRDGSDQTEMMQHSHDIEYWLRRAEETNCLVAEYIGCVSEQDLANARWRYERNNQANQTNKED